MNPEPLIHGRRKKVLFAAGAAAVLLVGFLLAPPRPMRPPSQERVAPILEEELEQRDPIRLLRGAQETGRRVSAFVVEVRPRSAPAAARDVVRDVPLDDARREPGGFGLLLPGGRVLTHLDALDGAVEPVVTTFAGDAAARLVAADAASGLALVQLVSEAGLPAASVGSVVPEAGTPAVAAARPEGTALVAALIIASADDERLTLSAASGITRPGTPVFSTAGEALAIAAGPRDPSSAWRIAPALARMEGRGDGGGASTLGLALQEPSDRLSAVLGEGGVPIADVRAGSPGAAAGLRAGDVLLRVNGTEVATADAARAAISALAPGAEVALEVRRRGLPLAVQARPALWRPPAGRPADASGISAGELLAPETLAALGLPRETRVTAVDGGPPPSGARAVAAWRRRKGPAIVQVATPEGRRLVAVEPAR